MHTDKEFYVKFSFDQSDFPTSFIVRQEFEESGELPFPKETDTPPEETPGPISGSETTFSDLTDRLMANNTSLRRTVPLTVQLMNLLAAGIVKGEIYDFCKSKGRCIQDEEEAKVYALPVIHRRQFQVNIDSYISHREGVEVMPQIFLMGLVSFYDDFLSDLLRLVLRNRPGTLSDKTFTLTQLIEAGSIEAAKESLISREVEEIMRGSHADHIAWIDKNLKMNAKLYERWPELIEMFERRNLHTHAAGKISGQYLRVCAAAGYDVSDLKVGEFLPVDTDYFKNCVGLYLEFGMMLLQKVWRSISPSESGDAAGKLNTCCFSLIKAKRYKIASSLLKFGLQQVGDQGSEITRKMMIVNYANALKLDKKVKESNSVLDAEDWSASKSVFQLCVAAVRDDVDAVLKLLKPCVEAEDLTLENIRDWPAFETLRGNEAFVGGFEAIFGESFYAPKTEERIVTSDEPSKETK